MSSQVIFRLVRVSGEFLARTQTHVGFWIRPKIHRKLGPVRKSGPKIPWAQIPGTLSLNQVRNDYVNTTTTVFKLIYWAISCNLFEGYVLLLFEFISNYDWYTRLSICFQFRDFLLFRRPIIRSQHTFHSWPRLIVWRRCAVIINMSELQLIGTIDEKK